MPPAPSDASFTSHPKLPVVPATKAATSLVTFQVITGALVVPVAALLVAAPKSPPGVVQGLPVCLLFHVTPASVHVAVSGRTSYVRGEAPKLVSLSFREAEMTQEPVGIEDRSNRTSVRLTAPDDFTRSFASLPLF
jgi:hypothetical protein